MFKISVFSLNFNLHPNFVWMYWIIIFYAYYYYLSVYWISKNTKEKTLAPEAQSQLRNLQHFCQSFKILEQGKERLVWNFLVGDSLCLSKAHSRDAFRITTVFLSLDTSAAFKLLCCDCRCLTNKLESVKFKKATAYMRPCHWPLMNETIMSKQPAPSLHTLLDDIYSKQKQLLENPLHIPTSEEVIEFVNLYNRLAEKSRQYQTTEQL